MNNNNFSARRSINNIPQINIILYAKWNSISAPVISDDIGKSDKQWDSGTTALSDAGGGYNVTFDAV